MIIPHVEMVAIVVFGNARFDVVRRVDVESAIEDIRRRIGHVCAVGNEVWRDFMCYKIIVRELLRQSL